MELPPRVKTQYPNKENISNDKITSLPLEYAFFREDGELDPSKSNRYYFNFPGNWITSNNGEIIVGVRDIWLVHKRRLLRFKIEIAKFKKDTYLKIKNRLESRNQNSHPDNVIAEMKIAEDAVNDLWIKTLYIIDWLSTEGDLRGFFDAVHNAIKAHIKGWWNMNEVFKQSDDDVLDRDIQTDGYYDNNGFHEIVYSPRNINDDDPYGICFRIISANNDFKEVFNVGEGPNENDPFILSLWNQYIIFDNVWDRHSCKIFSSIGEQCNHQYIGNSNVYFDPIKYFKLQSTDQRFWIEFYSARNYKMPVKLTKGETFCIEMQFLPFEKNLSI